MRTRLNDLHFVVFGPGNGGPIGFVGVPAAPAGNVPSPKVGVEVTFTQSVSPNTISVVCRKNGTVVNGTVSISPTVNTIKFLISVALSGVNTGDIINVTVSAPFPHTFDCKVS